MFCKLFRPLKLMNFELLFVMAQLPGEDMNGWESHGERGAHEWANLPIQSN